MENEISEVFGAAELAGAAIGMGLVSRKDYQRFWKWMMVPLMDVPDDELIWCYKQDRQNSYCSKSNWKAEIERRGLKKRPPHSRDFNRELGGLGF